MVHCSFHHVLKVLLDSFQVATHNYASLLTRDTAMLSYAVAYANFRPQAEQPTQHQEQFHFCINSFIKTATLLISMLNANCAIKIAE